MIGTTIGRYRIVAKLGGGGNGEVWRAEDTLLGRTVALKLPLLQPPVSIRAREDFIREAQLASRLNHAGIAAVYDAGEADGRIFIVYQYVEGEALAARLSRLQPGVSAPGGPATPLSIPELLGLAQGCAEALAHAHALGVLHRDLTARNIMLRPDGSPVIVDFGLARMLGEATSTATGPTQGTVSFMAPEQWRGEPADPRTDLWSLGVVLYVAATGQYPFPGATPEAVMYRVLHDDPEPPQKIRQDLPAWFMDVTRGLLEKERPRRTESASALLAELPTTDDVGSNVRDLARPSGRGGPAGTALARWLRQQAKRRFTPRQVALVILGLIGLAAAVVLLMQRTGQAHQKILAVLPMRNVSADAEGSAYLGEALGEELVRRLGDSHAVRLIPWATTIRFADSSAAPQRVASQLGADLLLTGSYEASEGRLEVHAELTDGRNGTHIWSDRFVRPEGDIIGVQTALAADVMRLAGRASSREAARALATSAPSNPEAYEYFIRGSNYWHSGDPAMEALAEPFFAEAVAMDSTLAGAWVGLGALLTDRYFRGDAAGVAELSGADSMFHRALRIQPGMPAAERGLIRLAYEREATGFRRQNLEIAARALQRDPTDVDQLTTAFWGFTLGSMAELALPIMNRLRALDPANQGLAWYSVIALNWSGRPSRCVAAGTDYIRRFGEDLEIYTAMAGSLWALGRIDEAVELAQRGVELSRDSPAHYLVTSLAAFYVDGGNRKAFDQLAAKVVPELEARVRANPDNVRLAGKLGHFYVLMGTERSVAARARLPLSSGPDDPDWEQLARLGRTQEALAAAVSRPVSDDRNWRDAVDTAGSHYMPRNPRILAVLRAPEFQAWHAAVDSNHVVLFEHYRRIVATYFPRDPDLPPPRSKWPRNPLPPGP